MSKYVFNDFLGAVPAAIKDNPNWRLGQAYFNVLFDLRPDLAERIRTTPLDPFYMPPAGTARFLEWLQFEWEVNNSE